MAKQISLNGYKYYAIYLAIAKAPNSQLNFADIEPAAKKVYADIDQVTLKSDLPGMFQNALAQNDRLKLYVKGNNVSSTRLIQTACSTNSADVTMTPTLWANSVWSVVPFTNVPSQNLASGSALSHGVAHRNRGVKPFKSYRAKLNQKLADHQDDIDQAKIKFNQTSEKAKVQLDKTSQRVKADADTIYQRVRNTSARLKKQWFNK